MDDLEGGRLFWILLGTAFFLVFLQANAPSLDSDGIHYASVAKGIAQTDHWLYPSDPIQSGPYYWHFPLSVWPTAALFEWFGVCPAVAKLYSMGMTVGAVAGIFLLGRILAGPWVGWCSGMAFLLTNHVLRIARQCRPDLPLIAFLVWAFVGLALAQNRSRRWYLLTGLACLGAVLTKEFVGLVPLAAAAAYFLLRRQWRELFHPLFLSSWLLALGPVMIWIRLEQAWCGDTLWRNYYHQSVLYFMHAPHLATPWYYYGWAILDKYGYFLPPALVGGWLAWKKIQRGEEPRWGMILLWAAALPIGFSLARHKVHYYILPMYAATALLVGLACERWIRGPWRARLVGGVMGMVLASAVSLICLRIPVHAVRYASNVDLAPQIDQFLAQAPGEVLVVRQDAASLYFYANRISGLTQTHSWPAFRDQLALSSPRRRYCLIGHEDWAALDPQTRSGWRVLLDHQDRYFLRKEVQQEVRLRES